MTKKIKLDELKVFSFRTTEAIKAGQMAKDFDLNGPEGSFNTICFICD